MREFLARLREFIKEIVMFGVDAFVVVAAREVGRRFWERLKGRGATQLLSDGEERPKYENKRPSMYRSSEGQSNMPFLDEYRD